MMKMPYWGLLKIKLETDALNGRTRKIVATKMNPRKVKLVKTILFDHAECHYRHTWKNDR